METQTGEIFAPVIAPEESAEHRHEKRRRTIKRGDIVFEHKQCLQSCVVMDMSDHGAKLKPDDPLHCPSVFGLRIGEETLHYCEVAWRQGDLIGVHFIDAPA